MKTTKTNTKEITAQKRDKLIVALRSRFEKNLNRHKVAAQRT